MTVAMRAVADTYCRVTDVNSQTTLSLKVRVFYCHFLESNMTEAKREQAFYVVRKDGRKIVMTLDCLFGEDDDSTEECLNDLKEAFADGASFAILDAEEAFQKYGELSELLKTAQAEVENKMNDLVQRAEKYLEDFGSSGKVADCLVQELVEALKNTSNALGFVEQCRKEWSEMAIKQKVHIEHVDTVAKQQIAYHQAYADKYINNDVERAKRHIERINAWQSITSLQVKR